MASGMPDAADMSAGGTALLGAAGAMGAEWAAAAAAADDEDEDEDEAWGAVPRAEALGIVDGGMAALWARRPVMGMGPRMGTPGTERLPSERTELARGGRTVGGPIRGVLRPWDMDPLGRGGGTGAGAGAASGCADAQRTRASPTSLGVTAAMDWSEPEELGEASEAENAVMGPEWGGAPAVRTRGSEVAMTPRLVEGSSAWWADAASPALLDVPAWEAWSTG